MACDCAPCLRQDRYLLLRLKINAEFLSLKTCIVTYWRLVKNWQFGREICAALSKSWPQKFKWGGGWDEWAPLKQLTHLYFCGILHIVYQQEESVSWKSVDRHFETLRTWHPCQIFFLSPVRWQWNIGQIQLLEFLLFILDKIPAPSYMHAFDLGSRIKDPT